MSKLRTFSLGVLILAAAACATSPLGRKQLLIVPEAEVDQMGVKSFQEMKQQTPISTDSALNSYIQCVVAPITEAARGMTDVNQWEVVVFKDPQVNAFALPGGKIGVYTGILPVTKTDSQLAAVVGHEVGHVIAKHGAERVSEQVATQGGLSLVNAFLGGGGSSTTNQLLMGALGLGTQVGILLPHSRTQESEADLIGLDLMSRAGFDPRQSVDLWKNMAAASGGNAPPEFMSTHPANETRIQGLQARMPESLTKYEQARAAGKAHGCKRPAGI